jgi:hypothetical protein
VIWIIDASVAVRWFIEEEAHAQADAVLEKVIDKPERFAVPELFAFEVFSVLQRLHPTGLGVFRKGILPLLQGGIFRQPMTESVAVKAKAFVNLGSCYAALALDLKGIWRTFNEQAHSLIQKEKISCLLEEEIPPGWPG